MLDQRRRAKFDFESARSLDWHLCREMTGFGLTYPALLVMG